MQACRSFKRIVSRMKQGTHRTSDRVLLFVVGVIVVSLLIPRWLNMAEEGYDGPLSSEVVSSLGNMGIVPDTKAMAAVEREYLAIMSRPRTESDEISLTSKQHRHTRVCRIEWMSSSNYGTMVEIDIETGYLVHYVETKAHSACVFEHSPMLCDAAAFTEAISFVEEHAYLPEDAVLSRVESNQFGKLVEWKHVVHSVPVKDDHIRVQMNDLSGAITSFSFIWNEVRESKKTGISAMQAIQEVYSNNLIRTGTQNVESARLEWIPEERGKGHYLLAWRIESDVAISWVNAQTGKLIRVSPFFIYYEAQAIMQDFAEYMTDVDGISGGYSTWEFVCNILNKHFDIVGERDPPLTESQWKSAMSCYVGFSIGHGAYDETYNFVLIDQNQPRVYPDEIYNAPERYLTYLHHCYSGSVVTTEGNSLGYQFVWRSRRITTPLGDVYDNAFVGFDGTINGDDGCAFTRRFWHALDIGYNVDAARSYASTQYPHVGNICRIFGDHSITLDG